VRASRPAASRGDAQLRPGLFALGNREDSNVVVSSMRRVILHGSDAPRNRTYQGASEVCRCRSFCSGRGVSSIARPTRRSSGRAEKRRAPFNLDVRAVHHNNQFVAFSFSRARRARANVRGAKHHGLRSASCAAQFMQGTSVLSRAGVRAGFVWAQSREPAPHACARQYRPVNHVPCGSAGITSCCLAFSP
jgi:hypothetical protein